VVEISHNIIGGFKMINIVFLLISLGIILFGAEIFTNGVEWLGKKLNLSEGAVGCILAAVGTALPETMIPVIAILFGRGDSGHEIGIGAILGAPFMLSTLALFISGIAVIVYKKKHPNFPYLNIDPAVMRRDLVFFIIVYTAAVITAFLNLHVYKMFVAVGLVIMYLLYVFFTLKHGNKMGEECDINPLLFDKRKVSNPRTARVIFQVIFALIVIVLGARIFVKEIEILSVLLGIPSFILALIIAPIATELPEKFNSVIWISKGKDTLAMGNITGAMVFQSSIIPAMGIILTPWILNFNAVISAVFALLSALIVYIQLIIRNKITAFTLLSGGVFYVIFISMVLLGYIH
jgi:cation:H+ antiporter